MPAPTKAELEKRAEELDDREVELVERDAELDRREAALVARREEVDASEAEIVRRFAELGNREATLAERIGGPSSTEGLTHPLAKAEGVTYAALPDPQPGNGFVVVEAPLPLVAVFAALHPSERGTISAQMAGAMRQTLMETGKLRGAGRAEPAPEGAVELAIVAGGVAS